MTTHSGESSPSQLRHHWSSVAYSIVGMGGAVDDALDLALALVLGRDSEAVSALYGRIAPTLNGDRKLEVLRQAVAGDDMATRTLAAASTVLRVRNILAHSVVAEATEVSALFRSSFRGHRREERLWDVEAWLLTMGHERLLRDLWCLAVRNSGPQLVGQVFGFLDD